MLATVVTTRSALEELAASFEPTTLTHDQAARLVDELGVIRRLSEDAREGGEARGGHRFVSEGCRA
jgi:hypothetical protein